MRTNKFSFSIFITLLFILVFPSIVDASCVVLGRSEITFSCTDGVCLEAYSVDPQYRSNASRLLKEISEEPYLPDLLANLKSVHPNLIDEGVYRVNIPSHCTTLSNSERCQDLLKDSKIELLTLSFAEAQAESKSEISIETRQSVILLILAILFGGLLLIALPIFLIFKFQNKLVSFVVAVVFLVATSFFWYPNMVIRGCAYLNPPYIRVLDLISAFGAIAIVLALITQFLMGTRPRSNL